MLDHMSQGYVALDAGLRVVGVNRAFEDITGKPTSLLLGRSLQDCFPQALPIVGDLLSRTYRTGEASEFEIDSALVEGRRYAMQIFANAGGVAVLLVNRTEDQLTERAKHEALALKLAVAGLADIATATLNLRGFIVSADKSMASLTGFEPAELLRLRLVDLFRPSDRRPLLDQLETGIHTSGKPTICEAALLIRGERDVHVQLSTSPVLNEGAPDGIMIACARRRAA